MRITQSMMLRDFQRRSEVHLQRMYEANTQLASGEKVNKPSDDPSALARINRYEESITRITRYGENADIARIWSETTQDSINLSSDLVQSALENALQASCDTTSTEANQGLAEEVRNYLDEILSLVNREENNRFIFSGTKTADKPFERLERDLTVVGSLPSGIDSATIASPFADMPELERSVYTVEVTSDGVNATVKLLDVDGSSVQIDDNNQDDTYYYSSFNHMANSVTVQLGETVNTGRGMRITTSSSMASGTQTLRFMYTPEGSFEYVGNAGAVKTKIGDDTIVDLNIAGHTVLQGDTTIGTKAIDAVNGTPVPTGGGDVLFMISDGQATRTITLSDGVQYSQDDILDILDQAGLFIGENDQYDDEVYISASFDDQGHLRLRNASAGVPSKIILTDIGSGTNSLQSYLGLTPGRTEGVAVLDALNRLTRNIEVNAIKPTIYAPSDWASDSKVDVSRDGVYTGHNDATWLFTVGSTGGLIGETSGLTITVTDTADGSVIKTIDVGDSYVSGTTIHIADGVDVSFSGLPGELEAGDSFTLDLRTDRSEGEALSDSIEQLVTREALAGSTLNYMELVTNQLMDYQALLSGQLEQINGVSIAEAVSQLQVEQNSYETSLAIGARILEQATLLDFL